LLLSRVCALSSPLLFGGWVPRRRAGWNDCVLRAYCIKLARLLAAGAIVHHAWHHVPVPLAWSAAILSEGGSVVTAAGITGSALIAAHGMAMDRDGRWCGAGDSSSGVAWMASAWGGSGGRGRQAHLLRRKRQLHGTTGNGNRVARDAGRGRGVAAVGSSRRGRGCGGCRELGAREQVRIRAG
jgi:hypothetical protein